MELNREQIVTALEILDKMDFFQGQRAGRELWFDKPFEVQEQDITDFSKGVEFVKNVITDALALIRELTEENERLSKTAEEGTLATTYSARPNIDQKAQIKELLEGGE